ncbi:hypothetical protein [Actinomadura sp. 9N407]|uniref:hypothetical protein n=1 Tax=Actinomadura sp. 9N407 TaxID=3375154 RepID=UPI0037AB94A2
MAAVRRHSRPAAQPAPATGSLRGDLLAVLEVMRAGLTGQDAALLFSRLFVTGEPLDDAFLRHLADDVLGVLLIGLFHAGPGAFGRRDPAS